MFGLVLIAVSQIGIVTSKQRGMSGVTKQKVTSGVTKAKGGEWSDKNKR